MPPSTASNQVTRRMPMAQHAVLQRLPTGHRAPPRREFQGRKWLRPSSSCVLHAARSAQVRAACRARWPPAPGRPACRARSAPWRVIRGSSVASASSSGSSAISSAFALRITRGSNARTGAQAPTHCIGWISSCAGSSEAASSTSAVTRVGVFGRHARHDRPAERMAQQHHRPAVVGQQRGNGRSLGFERHDGAVRPAPTETGAVQRDHLQACRRVQKVVGPGRGRARRAVHQHHTRPGRVACNAGN